MKEKERTKYLWGDRGYDSDTVLMNRALHKFFGHSKKCSQKKGRLKKKQIPSCSERKRKRKRKKEIPEGECVAVKTRPKFELQACMKSESLVIPCMKEETTQIKGKEKKIVEQKDGERED